MRTFYLNRSRFSKLSSMHTNSSSHTHASPKRCKVHMNDIGFWTESDLPTMTSPDGALRWAGVGGEAVKRSTSWEKELHRLYSHRSRGSQRVTHLGGTCILNSLPLRRGQCLTPQNPLGEFAALKPGATCSYKWEDQSFTQSVQVRGTS